jgi:Ca2+-binding RTX toxin-like protein
MSHKPQHQSSSDDTQDTQLSFGEHRLFIGGAGLDVYPGTGRMDTAFGRGGGYLAGGGENDDLLGGNGRDILIGAGGMDQLDGGKGADVLIGGAEADGLRGGDGRDYLDEGVGHGDLEGGAGGDILAGGLGGDAFVISPDSGNDVILDFQGGPGMLDHLAVRGLNAEDLRFEDTDAGAKISWDVAEGKGSVLLEGFDKSQLAQDDFMFTDDRQLIQPTSADAETVTAEKFIKDEGGNLSAPGQGSETAAEDAFRFDEFDVKVGTSGRDTFQGTDARDFYYGQDGSDHLSGGAGDDDLSGGAGRDVLDGGEGQDHLAGGRGSDQLYGGDQADNLMGDEGNDVLYAGAGHDMLDGGKGDDVLNGGDGADAFIVGPDTGNDIISGGFDAGPGAFDHLALRDIMPNEIQVEDVSGGVLVSWDTAQGDGSVLLQGLTKSQMAQDDFMFNADKGMQGAFVNDPAITDEGSKLIFQESPSVSANPEHDYLLA